MADPLEITVRPQSITAGNPFAEPEVERFADPIELNPRARDLIIRTIFGEDAARNDESRSSVASVIRNRVLSGRYGGSPEEVVLKPYAFEPWINPTARQRMLGLKQDDPNYQSIAAVVDQIFGGTLKDPTGGATHFFAPRAQAALGRNVPAWARGDPLANIGGHLFYAPDEPGRSSSPASRGGAVTASLRTAAPPTATDAGPDIVALASNKITPGNPFADAGPTLPPATAPVQKPTLPPEVKQPMGAGEALGIGAEQGLTYGFADELRGLGAAVANLPYAADAHSAVAIARLAWSLYQGNPNSSTLAAYEKARDAARQAYATAKQQYPGTTLTGELAGGAAVPLPGGPLGGAARTAMQRVGSGVLQGTVAGTLSGAGSAEGDISKRLGNAVIGGGAGGVLGGAVGGASPAAANFITRALHGLIFPERQAKATLARTAEQAGFTSPAGRVLPGQVTPDTMVADILGEPGRVLARGVKNIDPAAAATLQEATMDRARGQFPRLVTFLESKFGPLGDNAMAKLALKAEQAQVTTPMYERVMDAFPSGVGSQRLIDLLANNSTALKAGRDAAERLANRAAVENKPVPALDSLRFWDQVKREIQSKISVAKRAGDNETVNELTGLSRGIISELDNITGGKTGPYATARKTAEEYFSIDRAIDEGKRFVTSNQFSPQQAAVALRGMSPDAQEAFRTAGLSQLLDRVSRKGESHDIWKQLNNSPDAQAKMRVLFNGDQGAIREFEAMHHAENLMERLREAVRGNSTTVQQALAVSALTGGGGAASVYSGNFDPTTPGGASLLFGGAAAARKGANYRMAEHLAQMLVSRDPKMIERAVQAAAGDARIMNVLRTMAENFGAKSAGAAVGRNIGD